MFVTNVSTRKMDWCMSIKWRNILYIFAAYWNTRERDYMWCQIHTHAELKMRHTKRKKKKTKIDLFMYLYIYIYIYWALCVVVVGPSFRLCEHFSFSFLFSLFLFLFIFPFHFSFVVLTCSPTGLINSGFVILPWFICMLTYCLHLLCIAAVFLLLHSIHCC